MAYIRAYVSSGNPFPALAGVSVMEARNLTREEANRLSSEWMAMTVPKFTTESGLETDRPFGRVDIFDDNGRYITTAWGE